MAGHGFFALGSLLQAATSAAITRRIAPAAHPVRLETFISPSLMVPPVLTWRELYSTRNGGTSIARRSNPDGGLYRRSRRRAARFHRRISARRGRVVQRHRRGCGELQLPAPHRTRNLYPHAL